MRNLMKFGIVLVVLAMVTSVAFATTQEYTGPDGGTWCDDDNWDKEVPRDGKSDDVFIDNGNTVVIDTCQPAMLDRLEIEKGGCQVGTETLRVDELYVDEDLRMSNDKTSNFSLLAVINGNVYVEDQSKDVFEDGSGQIIVAAGSSLLFDDGVYFGDSNGDGCGDTYTLDIAGSFACDGDRLEHRGGHLIINLTGNGSFDISDKTARLSSKRDAIATIDISDNATFITKKLELGEGNDGADCDYSMEVNVSGNGSWDGDNGDAVKDQDDGQILNINVTGNGSVELKDLSINNDGSEINITMDGGTFYVSDDIEMNAGVIVITGGTFYVEDNFELGDDGVATMTVSGTAVVFIDDLYMGEDSELTINDVRMDLDDLKDLGDFDGSIEINGAGSLVMKDADLDDMDDIKDLIADGDITTSNPGMVIVADYGISHGGRFTIQPAIPVQVDIKPGSSSNPLRVNFGGSGVMPVAIIGTDDLDVTTIDAGSATLEGVAVRKGKVGDINGDGTPDLVLKFSRTAILDALEAANGDLGELPNREELTLILFAESTEGLVSGTDTLVILNHGRINRSRR